MSRRIYVDLDDVIADTTTRFPAVVQQLFGRSKDFEDIHTFHLDRAFGLSSGELERLFAFVHDGDFLRELEPREGALELLADWRDSGHEVRIVTGRPPQSRSHSIDWLQRHDVPHDRFDLCDKYDRFEVGEDVLHLDDVRALDFDLAVEDSLDIASLLAGWGVARVFLLDRPWNRDHASLPDALQTRVERVASWAEIREGLAP